MGYRGHSCGRRCYPHQLIWMLHLLSLLLRILRIVYKNQTF